MWWSIYILDKLVSTGSRRRCLISDLQPDGRLPVDDEAWVRFPQCLFVRPELGGLVFTSIPPTIRQHAVTDIAARIVVM